MNFEYFPNEILLECFQYFDALELFQSFGQLNLRFSKLIRTCPLNLSFHYVHKSIFDRFCQIMLSNSEIRSQILSLHLSNERTAGQIKLFLSLFSFEQFPNLRSLSLTKIRSGNVSQLKSMLPLLSKLSSFHLNETDIEIDEIISVLPLSLLHTLTLRTPVAILTTQDQMRSLRYLTLCDCRMSALYHL
ncbi:hypothetical protein I4U23_011798 [Adineta vaga]|nr:hypothetical protein I4U23_011798 [Adineta vaga]